MEPLPKDQIRATLREIPLKLKKFNPKIESKAAEMKHGWMLPALLQIDSMIWGRWEYWHQLTFFSIFSKKFPDEICLPDDPIPQIEFGEKHSMVEKMVLQCIDIICDDGYHFHKAVEFFLDWLLWGFGHISQPIMPIYGSEGKVHEKLYQVFQLGWLQTYPYDYLGSIMAEYGVNKGLQFYPTPMNVCGFMTKMAMPRLDKADPEDTRLTTTLDPCVGTGRFLLYASNYSLALNGQDISELMIKTTLVNAYMYAPWVARPIRLIPSNLLIGNSLSEEMGRSIHRAPDDNTMVPLYRMPANKSSVDEEESEVEQPIGWQTSLF